MNDLKNNHDNYIEDNRLSGDLGMLLTELMDSTLAGWWDWDIPNDIEYMSPGFKRMFGYQDHEIKNTPEWWQTNIHQDDLPGVFEVFEKHVQSKGEIPYDNTVRYYHKDGSIVWVYCRGKVIEWDDMGNPIRMIGTHVNITQERALAQQLEEKIEELQSINDLMVDREIKMKELKARISELEAQLK